MPNMYGESGGGYGDPRGAGNPLANVRGRRLGGQGHLGQLAKLHPNHPIFKKFPGLAHLIHARSPVPPMPPGVVPPPGSDTAPDPGAQTAPPVPEASGEAPSYMQNIPTDMSGYGAWGAAPPPEDPNVGRMAGMEGDVRSRLMQRFHTAGPQDPMLTSRQALRQHLRQQTGRMAQRRQPMLPLRRPY